MFDIFLVLEHRQRQWSCLTVMNSFLISPPKMLWMLCSSMLIHLAKTLVSWLTDSSQLFGLPSFSASMVANTKRFFPDIGLTVLKSQFIRHTALKFHVETFFFLHWIFKMFWPLQSLLSSSTNQFNLIMSPHEVWSVCAESRNYFRRHRPSILTGVCQPLHVCFEPVWLNFSC